MSAAPQRKPKGHFWRRLRIWFRRFRITVLLLLLALVCIGGYLNYFGLPGFIKGPLLDNLRSHGVDIEFSRLRLRWYRGIVADDVRVLNAGDNQALPQFHARSADVRLNYAALARLKIEVTGVVLRDGNVIWQLAATNEPPRELAITNINASLRFLPGDEWCLDQLRARFLDAQFEVNARITNASALRSLPIFQDRSKPASAVALRRLRTLHDVLEKIHFTRPPDFRLTVTGDAADPLSFAGDFTVNAPDVTTPWGEMQNARLEARLDAAVSNLPPIANLSLAAEFVRTKQAAWHKMDLKVKMDQTDTDEIHCILKATAAELRSDWAMASSGEVNAEWRQGLDSLTPRNGALNLRLATVNSKWAQVETLALRARFHASTIATPADPFLGWWVHAIPFTLALECAATNVTRDEIHLKTLAAEANWESPRLDLSRLEAHLPDGSLAAHADVDIFTRRLEFDGKAQFDFHLLDPLLTEAAREWIGNFTWQQPPSVTMAGYMILPAWTNRQPDWHGEVQPGIALNGHVNLTNGSYLGISAISATTHLNYSNRVWRLPDLIVTRPEGTLHAALQSDEVSHDFWITLRGPFDFRALATQLDEKGRRGLGYFEFTTAPWIEGEVRGRWHEHERSQARASVTWTNFSFRAQHADRLAASIEYTNQMLTVVNPLIERGSERITADGIKFDFAANRAYLTNGYSDTDPMAIAIAIGPKVAAAVTNYQFLKPPVARVSGVIPLRGERDADLHFDLAGGPFRWMKFNLPSIAGHVCWANESVTLSNITASFYGGEARGNAWFDVQERSTTPFRFDLTTTNADLHDLMSDLHSSTNRLGGRLTGQLVITSANTTNWHTWNGHGQATLRDGLIWDTPIFGIMSAVMNTFVPGIGNSRASEAGGTFTITNSVIYTRDLDVRASGMRLQYDGTVDFSTHVDAQVQADLLRDTWLVGKLVSTALWPVTKLFKYKVTGTLAEPKPEPVYLIPRLLLSPLHPVKAIKDVFQYSPGGTNAPGEFPAGAPVKANPPPEN